jgi:hypothetical protein
LTVTDHLLVEIITKAMGESPVAFFILWSIGVLECWSIGMISNFQGLSTLAQPLLQYSRGWGFRFLDIPEGVGFSYKTELERRWCTWG